MGIYIQFILVNESKQVRHVPQKGLGSMYRAHPIELITENVALCKL